MTKTVSTAEVRQHIGDLLNRVALRSDEFIIERKGTALAALVPVEKLDQLRRMAREGLSSFLERQKTGPGAALKDDQAMALALSAQRSARSVRSRATKSKRHRK